MNRKEGGKFYREILWAANPKVASLPSTNGGLPHRRVPLRSGAVWAREWNHTMLRRVARVPGLLSPQMAEVVEGGPDALAAFGSWNSRSLAARAGALRLLAHRLRRGPRRSHPSVELTLGHGE